jgi:molybdopterin converting factor small subunit
MPLVRLFASLRELAGARSVELEGATVEELLSAAAARFGPEFDRIARAGSVVVGGERAGADLVVRAGDDVAFLPPFSGGASRRAGARLDDQAVGITGTMTVPKSPPDGPASDAGSCVSGASAGRYASE